MKTLQKECLQNKLIKTIHFFATKIAKSITVTRCKLTNRQRKDVSLHNRCALVQGLTICNLLLRSENTEPALCKQRKYLHQSKIDFVTRLKHMKANIPSNSMLTSLRRAPTCCQDAERNFWKQNMDLVFKLVVMGLTIVQLCDSTPLDDYVFRDDGYFKVEIINSWTYKGPAHTSYLINMTSQKWLTDNDTSRSVWWHHLIVSIPDKFDMEMGFSGYMKIVGGNNNNPSAVPSVADTDIMISASLAERTGSVSAVLKHVPNQSLMFKTDPKQLKREEDGIIAFTWRHFIDDPSKPEWLLRMPMTKAAVKAMDAINGLVMLIRERPVENFCVGGESKRGWTTWTTAAVDSKRVKCITPIVMDELNMVKNLHHHYRAYGGWTFEFDDYYLENVTRDLDHPNTQKLADIVDPYSYRDRLTMPKMVISTGSDEFFLPDDSYYYLSDMKGPTYLSMMPNTDHSCDGKETKMLDNIAAFYVSCMKGYKLPTFHWNLNSSNTEGSIYVQSDTKPSIVRAWYATTMSSKRRDFRRYKLNETHPTSGPVLQPILWVFDGVQQVSDTEYMVKYDVPKTGWLAFFIQMTFPVQGGSVIEFTTETNIIPNVLPYPDCSGNSCFGNLV